jgi:cytochrome c oxidase assembly factor CtaG
MAFNPLSPQWPAQMADAIDNVVQVIRRNLTLRAVKATNAVVFGLLAGFAALVAAVLGLIVAVRSAEILLTWNLGTVAAWIVGSVALVGLLTCAAGVIRSSKLAIGVGFVVLVSAGGRWALHAGHAHIAHRRAVWIADLAVGAVFVFVGTLLMAKRHAPSES